DFASRWSARYHPRAAPLTAAGLAIALVLGGIGATRAAIAPPERYATLLDDCTVVDSLTRRDEEILVIADRGGPALFYCDRRGVTFTPATELGAATAEVRMATGAEALGRSLESTSWVFLPFPDLVPPAVGEFFDREWDRVPVPGRAFHLYVRRGGRHEMAP